MCKTILISSPKRSKILDNMLYNLLGNNEFEEFNPKIHKKIQNSKIIFTIELNDIGICPYTLNVLEYLNSLGNDCLINSTACILIRSSSKNYTKSFCQQVIFLCNMLGCYFIGHPIVEVIHDFENFKTWQKNMAMSLEDICYTMCRNLGERFFKFTPTKKNNPNMCVLHASLRETSNTLTLWYMIKKHLNNININELHVENGLIHDCIGCPYKTCIYFAKQKSCFYGGSIVKEVFPAIEDADCVVFISPNYNDAVSATLCAVINRITALYRLKPFYDKTLFSVIVSGNSGGDSVAKQLIGALNINKGFILPPYFAIMEIANDKDEIKKVKDIDIKSYKFAKNILTTLLMEGN